MSWGKQGKQIANKLEETTDASIIETLGLKTIQEIKDKESPEKQRNALKMVSREILKIFPRRESEAACYYYDHAGKADLPKWRHLIFKSLTLDSAVRGDDQTTEQATEQTTEQPTKQPTEQTITTLNDVTIEQLELDADTQQTLENALDQLGMPLPNFIRQAIKVYAKTITGKTRKQSEDLSTVSTDKLLNDPTYSTHPGRAEELTKRAIKAIKYYNANIATEKADRWCITQSAIASLTGSRASTVGKVLEQFKDDIDSHNQTYNLDNYSNRKRGKPSIEETIDLTELTPDGLD
jgi:hypothetical protein